MFLLFIGAKEFAVDGVNSRLYNCNIIIAHAAIVLFGLSLVRSVGSIGSTLDHR